MPASFSLGVGTLGILGRFSENEHSRATGAELCGWAGLCGEGSDTLQDSLRGWALQGDRDSCNRDRFRAFSCTPDSLFRDAGTPGILGKNLCKLLGGGHAGGTLCGRGTRRRRPRGTLGEEARSIKSNNPTPRVGKEAKEAGMRPLVHAVPRARKPEQDEMRRVIEEQRRRQSPQLNSARVRVWERSGVRESCSQPDGLQLSSRTIQNIMIDALRLRINELKMQQEQRLGS